VDEKLNIYLQKLNRHVRFKLIYELRNKELSVDKVDKYVLIVKTGFEKSTRPASQYIVK